MNIRKVSEEQLLPRSSDKSFTTPPPFTFARYSVAHRAHPERNEDCILADQLRGLAGVFDGVGGRGDGHVASRTAARVIGTAWKRILAPIQEEPGVLSSCSHLDLPETLQTLAETAHKRIHREGERLTRAMNGSASTGKYPGTTFVLSVFCRQDDGNYTMIYAYVGDSRIYLLREHEPLQRLTEDDGYFSLLLQKGAIEKSDILRIDQATHANQLTETELSYFHKRNGITQSLGDRKTPDIHIDQVNIVPGDRILLCSDGVHDNLIDREIEDILRYGTRTTVARLLVNSALRRSDDKDLTLRAKADDISAIVITCRS